MIILEQPKLIHINTVRTASTSVAVELSTRAKEGDAVSELDSKEHFYLPRERKGVYQYSLARDLTAKQRKQYSVFCIEREPVSKCISHYQWITAQSQLTANIDISWEDYLDSTMLPIDDFRYTNGRNSLIVDKIIKYENIKEELNEYLPFKMQFKIHARQSQHQDITVTDQQRELIYHKFKNSNKFTGYEL